jgi:hypothetical protein
VISVARPINAISIVKVENRRTINEWLSLPDAIFAGDPAWVRPLNFQERRRISIRKAPFFTFGEAALFIAYRGDSPVGRISAQINRRHLERHRDAIGHFGFFDCFDDPEAARSLVKTAADWLSARGLSRMVGPLNFSLNEECGCLVSGFDTPPAVLMTHARPWTGPLLEMTGLVKEMDLFAYRIVPTNLAQRIFNLADIAKASPSISIRQIDMRQYVAEMRIVVDIFNDAWSANWGFVPFSSAEIEALLAELRPLFRGEYGRFVLFNNEPVGVMVALPNINEAIASFHGRLLPFNWIKLLWALSRQRIRSARVPLLGLKQAYQSTPVGGMLLTLLLSEFLSQMQAYHLDWVEFSWILETNRRMIAIAEMAAGPPIKTYRIYGKELF